MEWVVAHGLRHRRRDGISALGIDEGSYILYLKHLTLADQVDESRFKKAYCHRRFELLRACPFHARGNLAEPKITDRFFGRALFSNSLE